MKLKRILLSSVALAFFITSIVAINLNAVNAQSTQGPGNGFKISPVRYEMVLDKGASEIVKLTIENPTASPIEATVIINDFEANPNETGEPKILLDPSTSVINNSFKTITSTPRAISLAPKGRVELPVTITIKNDSSAGGYYGAVRVVPNNPSEKNVSLAASVGTIFLVTVPGKLTEQLTLVQFSVAKNGSNGRFFLNSGDMSIVTRLNNTGNIHVKPFGKVQISDNSGKVLQEYEFNNTDPRANILPNSTRKFTDNLKSQKWLGKYTVTANLGYGSTGSLITAKTYFWVIPTWFVVVALTSVLAIVVIAFVLYFVLHSRSRWRQIEKSPSSPTAKKLGPVEKYLQETAEKEAAEQKALESLAKAREVVITALVTYIATFVDHVFKDDDQAEKAVNALAQTIVENHPELAGFRMNLTMASRPIKQRASVSFGRANKYGYRLYVLVESDNNRILLTWVLN
ncbi:MAG: hypothetical protein WCP03_04865 [Candidatus Saccharibacteria bacterium]